MKFLGVNIDHVATLRNARAGKSIDPIMRTVNIISQCNGVKYITVHLREDRRHIIDSDVSWLCKHSPLKTNLEIACTNEMIEIALINKPHTVCFVPENRKELTTESGINLSNNHQKIENATKKLQDSGINVTLFLDPIEDDIHIAKKIGVNAIEIHTGQYSEALGANKQKKLDILRSICALIGSYEIECHAGHGLSYQNVVSLANIDQISLFNIGYFIVCEAIYNGIEHVINKMLSVINAD